MNSSYLKRAKHAYNTHRMFADRVARGYLAYTNYAKLWEQYMFFYLFQAAERGEL